MQETGENFEKSIKKKGLFDEAHSNNVYTYALQPNCCRQ